MFPDLGLRTRSRQFHTVSPWVISRNIPQWYSYRSVQDRVLALWRCNLTPRPSISQHRWGPKGARVAATASRYHQCFELLSLSCPESSHVKSWKLFQQFIKKKYTTYHRVIDQNPLYTQHDSSKKNTGLFTSDFFFWRPVSVALINAAAVQEDPGSPTHLKNMRKSNWIMKPQVIRGENKEKLKPPPSHTTASPFHKASTKPRGLLTPPSPASYKGLASFDCARR